MDVCSKDVDYQAEGMAFCLSCSTSAAERSLTGILLFIVSASKASPPLLFQQHPYSLPETAGECHD